jgi:hypothetical protein
MGKINKKLGDLERAVKPKGAPRIVVNWDPEPPPPKPGEIVINWDDIEDPKDDQED